MSGSYRTEGEVERDYAKKRAAEKVEPGWVVGAVLGLVASYMAMIIAGYHLAEGKRAAIVPLIGAAPIAVAASAILVLAFRRGVAA